jgi:dTDP-glucose 4,6-dehydratase
MSKRILVTGGCGFIGHHFVEHVLKNTDWEIVVLDRLTYASHGFDRLRDIEAYDDKRVQCLTHDFTQPVEGFLVDEIGKINYIVHLGAETHVDNSIIDPRPFVKANVAGTMEMLEFARKCDDLELFFYFSTDEVFGPAPEGTFYKEWDRYNSTNPYSAAKAGGEELCLAYANTYGIPMVITHTMNAYGERQHHEKFIPLVIKSCLTGDTVFIHSNPERTQAGSRHYIHCRNIADAVLYLICFKGDVKRDKFNIVGEKEVDNETLAVMIAEMVGEPLKYSLVDFHSSRPGHDLRYALDGSKMADIGWSPPVDFEESLDRTVQWTMKNKRWLGLN